ncbi:hypothetical protein AAFC00_001823 [Neodothiora populina]|uniref:Uncharacterized protein n=1 Tax=Neodothiora populina TaxID=2781224 RepID=A0ABR3PQI1_9PEZI
MASEFAVNGDFAPHQGYDQNHTGYPSATSNYHSAYSNPASASAAAPATQSASSSAADIPKDEVGWYFVEQYYTTLSRSPEKLFLFYNKRSQYVSGNETEKVAVSVGQRAINDRIKELEFQDCKVRVTNVDSQASDQNIVIQVIGEISNKSAPHKKFTQTFVLAGQTNGYFVLNDIFRYIVDEEDEVSAQEVQEESAAQSAPADVQKPAPAAEPETAEPETLTSSSDPAAIERDAAELDKELEEKIIEPETSAAAAAAEAEPEVTTNGTPKEEAPAQEEAPAPAAVEEPAAAAVPEPAAPEALVEEKPKDPEPTPAMSPAKQPAAQPAAPAAQSSPAAPAKPAAPKTWANLAAAAHRVVMPAIPTPQSPASSTAPQPKAASTLTQTTAPVPSAAPASAAAGEPSPSAGQQDEWTSVGGDHKRQQSKAQAAGGAQEAPQYRAYIKNVNDTIDAKDLRAELEKFGELLYFDVARQKNCAFVDFKTAEGYKGAMDANPHQIGNERVVVEERRMKPGSYPYVQRGGMRGGRGGSSGQTSGRGSFQGGRGGFSQRGRGSGANRGRGGAQAA